MFYPQALSNKREYVHRSHNRGPKEGRVFAIQNNVLDLRISLRVAVTCFPPGWRRALPSDCAKKVLDGQGASYTERDVVQLKLQHRPGELAGVASQLGDTGARQGVVNTTRGNTTKGE